MAELQVGITSDSSGVSKVNRDLEALRQRLRRLNGGFDEANRKTSTLGSRLQRLGQTSFRLNGIMTALGITAGGVLAGAAIRGALEFETSMSRIVGLVGVAKEEVEGFEEPLRAISRETGKGPGELADALFFVTSAGARGQEALDILEASARSAAAGLGETKQVADAVTSAINAYGSEALSASDATDILTATVREGKAEADSIAASLGQVLPAASELGVEFDELGATIAALTRIGLNAEQGSTALAATLATIQKPSKDARDVLQEFGLSATELRRIVDEEGLLAALQELRDRFGDNEEALTRVFPNIRALRAILPLVGKNAGDVEQIFDSLADATGATDEAFEAYAETSQARINKALQDLNNTLQVLATATLPAVATAFEKVTSFIVGATEVAEGFGEALAAGIGFNEDPYIQVTERIREIQDAIEALETTGAGGAFAQLNNLLGRDFGGIELSGSREEQIAQAEAELVKLREIEQQLEREAFQRIKAGSAARDQADALQEIEVTVERIGQASTAARIIDADLLEEGQVALSELQDNFRLAAEELSNLQTLGRDGIGIAEDAQIASEVMAALQGQTRLTEDEVRQLVTAERQLRDAIDEVTGAFERQDAALDTIDGLRQRITDIREQLDAAATGGVDALLATEDLQQARLIMADLGADTNLTVQEVTRLIAQERELTAALQEVRGASETAKEGFDVINEFGIQAARNIQSAFANFLFDPFEEGLQGMVFKFAESIKRIAAELLANQILTNFFNSLSGFGGPVGTFAQAALGTLGGNQFGGPVSAGVPGIVNERLSARGEVFVPSQSGRVMTKQQARDAVQGAAQAPAPEVNINNVVDPQGLTTAIESNSGQEAILNVIRLNPDAIRRALN